MEAVNALLVCVCVCGGGGGWGGTSAACCLKSQEWATPRAWLSSNLLPNSAVIGYAVE